jgi:hypothetical protein
MTRFLSWFLLLVLLGALVAVVVVELRARAEAGKDFPPYSMYSHDRDGLAAAAEALRRFGWQPVPLTEPVQRAQDRGLLLLVEPKGHALLPGEPPDLGETDVQALLHWVEEGNTLLFSCGYQTSLHHALGVQVIPEGGPDERATAEVAERGPYTAGTVRVEVEGRTTLDSAAGLPLWYVGRAPGALLFRRGKGRVLVTADPSMLTRRGLRREDNGVFLYDVARAAARDGRVYFDEYHHDLRTGGGFLGYLRYYNVQWTLVPILLVVLVAVWRAAVRLGPAVPAPPPGRADAVAYASAVARIYHRAGARRLPARTLARDFLAALARHLRLRPTALPAEVLAAWQERSPGESARRLQGLLRGLAELRKGDVSDRRMLAWARAFDDFTKDLAPSSPRRGR